MKTQRRVAAGAAASAGRPRRGAPIKATAEISRGDGFGGATSSEEDDTGSNGRKQPPPSKSKGKAIKRSRETVFEWYTDSEEEGDDGGKRGKRPRKKSKGGAKEGVGNTAASRGKASSGGPAARRDGGRRRVNPRAGKSHDELWDENYEKLRDYKEEHRNCNVPKTDAKDGQLGEWVCKQRRRHKEGKLSLERKERLDQIGFLWNGIALRNDHEDKWKKRFGQLQAFKEVHEHCNVPRRYPKLGQWVNDQRRMYKKKKLSDERKRRLQEIGFQWSVKKGPRRSDVMAYVSESEGEEAASEGHVSVDEDGSPRSEGRQMVTDERVLVESTGAGQASSSTDREERKRMREKRKDVLQSVQSYESPPMAEAGEGVENNRLRDETVAESSTGGRLLGRETSPAKDADEGANEGNFGGDEYFGDHASEGSLPLTIDLGAENDAITLQEREHNASVTELNENEADTAPDGVPTIPAMLVLLSLIAALLVGSTGTLKFKGSGNEDKMMNPAKQASVVEINADGKNPFNADIGAYSIQSEGTFDAKGALIDPEIKSDHVKGNLTENVHPAPAISQLSFQQWFNLVDSSAGIASVEMMLPAIINDTSDSMASKLDQFKEVDDLEEVNYFSAEAEAPMHEVVLPKPEQDAIKVVALFVFLILYCHSLLQKIERLIAEQGLGMLRVARLLPARYPPLLSALSFVTLVSLAALVVFLLSAIGFQRRTRRLTEQKVFNQAATVLQSLVRGWLARFSFRRRRHSSICIQSFAGMDRMQYCQRLSNAALIEGFSRGWLAGTDCAAAELQFHVRGWLARSSFCRKLRSTIRIQAIARMCAQRKRYYRAKSIEKTTKTEGSSGSLVTEVKGISRNVAKIANGGAVVGMQTMTPQRKTTKNVKALGSSLHKQIAIEAAQKAQKRNEDRERKKALRERLGVLVYAKYENGTLRLHEADAEDYLACPRTSSGPA